MITKTSKNYDFRKILKPFENQWVALTADNKKVVSSGKTLIDVSDKTKGKEVVYMKVLPFDVAYAPVFLCGTPHVENAVL